MLNIMETPGDSKKFHKGKNLINSTKEKSNFFHHFISSGINRFLLFIPFHGTNIHWDVKK
jgi:hypothetical protein